MASSFAEEAAQIALRGLRAGEDVGAAYVVEEYVRDKVKELMSSSLRQKTREQLVRPAQAGAPPAKRMRTGRTRTTGNYGRWNNPENRTQENKWFDTALSFTFASTAVVPASGQLALIPQGTEGDERIGRKTTIHSIQLRAQLAFAPAANDVSGLAYLYLVQDMQCNGSAAGVSDILTGTNLATALINMSNSSRFRILKRFVWELNQPGVAASGTYNTPVFRHLEYFKKCRIPMEYSSTTGAIGEIKSNNIFLVAGCSSGVSGLIDVSGACRLRFSD